MSPFDLFGPPPTTPQADPDVLARHAAGIVRLTLDKAAAHHDSPSRYPLPDDKYSLDRALADKLGRLRPEVRAVVTKAAAGRVRTPRVEDYGSAAALGAGGKTPILDRALQQSLPADVRGAADRLRATVARLKPSELRPPRPALVPTQADLVLKKVTCKQKTKGEVGKDEIDMAATGHDVYHLSDTTTGPFRVGKFNAKDANEKTYATPKVLASFPVLDGAEGGMVFPATLYLAEKDFGGFKKYIAEAGSVSDHEMQELLTVAMVTSVTSLTGLAAGRTGVAALIGREGVRPKDLLPALALGLLGSPASGLLLLPLPLGIFRNPIIRGAVAIAVLAARDWLVSVFKDEVFPPFPTSLFLTSHSARPDQGLQPQTVPFTRLNAKSLPIGQYEADIEWRVKFGPKSDRPAPAGPPPTEAQTDQQALKNLEHIEHIVVLMQENRSFDHMLGYLTVERNRPDKIKLPDGKTVPIGLKGNESNDVDLNGKKEKVRVNELSETALPVDPGHNINRVGRQLWGSTDWEKFGRTFQDEKSKKLILDLTILPDGPEPSMIGFAEDFKLKVISEKQNRQPPEDTEPVTVTLDELKPVMGYYPSYLVPAFDLLATEFAVCAQWYSSFPGSTWVNRTISLVGAPATRTKPVQHPKAEHQTDRVGDNDMPFDERAFTQVLPRDVTWAWYSQDVPSLIPIDASYAAASGTRYHGITRFFNDVQKGRLPNVTFLDPNFIDTGRPGETLVKLIKDEEKLNQLPYGFLGKANDDHPPADISHGQDFVLQVLLALMQNPTLWEKTLLVITYDEHGGFYDHVPPPKLPTPPESPAFKYLGCRVPTLVASPWIGRGLVSTRQFDHTSIIRTILEKFCRKPDGSIPDLGPRVEKAAHLGWLLNNPTPRKSLGPNPNGETRSTTLRRRSVRAVLNLRKHDDQRAKAGKTFEPTELQLQIREARKRLKGGPPAANP